MTPRFLNIADELLPILSLSPEYNFKPKCRRSEGVRLRLVFGLNCRALFSSLVNAVFAYSKRAESKHLCGSATIGRSVLCRSCHI